MSAPLQLLVFNSDFVFTESFNNFQLWDANCSAGLQAIIDSKPLDL